MPSCTLYDCSRLMLFRKRKNVCMEPLASSGTKHANNTFLLLMLNPIMLSHGPAHHGPALEAHHA